jgi:hypothetical protein
LSRFGDFKTKMAQHGDRIGGLSAAAASAVLDWAENRQLQIMVESATTSGNPVAHEQSVGQIMILEELAAEMERIVETKTPQSEESN